MPVEDTTTTTVTTVSTEQFLRTVVQPNIGESQESEAFFCLLIGNQTKVERWFHWPQDLPTILHQAEVAASTENVYFSTYLYSKPDSHKENVLPTHTMQADLDAADISELALRPTVLVETSPGRHQGYWVIKNPLPLDEHEKLSKRLTYSINNCDRSGWPLGRRVRMPGTMNYKYNVPRPVRVVETSLGKYTTGEIEAAFKVSPPTTTTKSVDDEWIDHPPILEVGTRELLAKYQSKLPRKVVVQFDKVASDRSSALWALMRGLFRAGASRDEVYWLSWHSANNKFKVDLKYNQDRDLAKDVLRAEQASHESANTDDLHRAFNEIRKLPGIQSEKRAYMSRTAIEMLSLEGEFVEGDDGTTWYLHSPSGRPIQISKASQYLEALCESKFGLNASESEYRYVSNSLMTHARERGKPVVNGSLSWFNKESKTLLLHSGKKDVYAITPNGVQQLSNGAYNVMFPWRLGDEPFALEKPLDDWTKTLFEGYFDNAVGLTHEEATTLFKVWILFILFRNAAVSRPILALFGQPGSGKSTLFRLMYTLLYGPRKGLSSITNPDDFDHAVSVDPFVVLDNVDTWSSWLPDRLALAAATSDITKRKLYTDSDTVILKRQAVIGISAHNPRFGREDVIDRLLLINFRRLTTFRSETDLLDKVWRLRNRLWGSIAADVQKCLKTTMPLNHEVPSFRIKDFALYGTWIARATGCEELFKQALEATRVSQASFTLGEEGILIDSIRRWQVKRKDHDQFLSAGELWNTLLAHSLDPGGFTKAYRNSVSFNKKLWTLQETLRGAFNVEVQEGPPRLWKIEPAATTTPSNTGDVNGKEDTTTSHQP